MNLSQYLIVQQSLKPLLINSAARSFLGNSLFDMDGVIFQWNILICAVMFMRCHYFHHLLALRHTRRTPCSTNLLVDVSRPRARPISWRFVAEGRKERWRLGWRLGTKRSLRNLFDSEGRDFPG